MLPHNEFDYLLNLSRETRKRIKLFSLNNKCHWCQQPTILFVDYGNNWNKLPMWLRDKLATIDHLISRYKENRREPNYNNEIRQVLSCYKCNHLRAEREEQTIDIEIRRKRSGRLGKHENVNSR